MNGAQCGGRQVAQQLARTAKQVADAAAEAERRSELLAAWRELEEARAECAWLDAYDKDDARYKARTLFTRSIFVQPCMPGTCM